MFISNPKFWARLGTYQAINFNWSSYGSYFGDTQLSQSNNNDNDLMITLMLVSDQEKQKSVSPRAPSSNKVV